MPQVNTVARAFELARAKECKTMAELIRRLRKEGFHEVEMHLDGSAIRGQLNDIMKGRAE